MTIPGQDASPTATGAGETVTQQDYKALYEKAQADIQAAQQAATEYKQRHSGLQGRYQQEQEKWSLATDKVIGFEAQLKTLMGEKEALLLERDTLTKTAAEKSAEATKASAKAERLNLIAEKHPELLSLEAKGALPEGTGDDFVAKLALLSQAITGKGSQAVTDFRKGETPPPPREAVTGTSVAMLHQANSAAKQGKLDEYNRLYDQYIALKRDGK